MPQIFNDAVMTNDGRALLSREIAGECMIQITRMAAGNGIYTESEKAIEELQKMTGLKNEVQSTGLSTLKRIDRTSILVSGVFTNDNVDTAYHINEIGLYAQEKGSKGTEVLYSVAVVAEREGEIMPASEGKNPVRIIQDWIVTVSNSANATIETLPDGAFAMAADVGNVDELDTQKKENLVSAVNETLRRLIVTDTSGVLGKKEAEVEAQALLDEIADKVMEKLLLKTGDSADNTVGFESGDNADAQSWTDVEVMEKNEKHKSLFGKISTMFKNVRYLYRLLGTTDISVIKNGTVTGILNELKQIAFTGIYSDLKNKPLALPASDVYSWAKQAAKPSYTKSEVGLGNVNNTSDKDKPVSTAQQTALDKKVNFADISRSTAVNIAGKKVLDAMEKNALVEGTLAHDISQIYSKLQIQIYDFVVQNPFTNGTTYRVQESNWMAVNKIYKIGRICWLALDVDLKNVTIGNAVLNIANVPDEYGPLSILSTQKPDEYDIGFYPGGNLIYVAHRNTEKYPNWSDVDPVRFCFVYFSKRLESKKFYQKNNSSIWIYGIFKLPHLRKIQTPRKELFHV